MHLSDTTREIVTIAMGYEVDDDRIKEAINKYDSWMTQSLKEHLKNLKIQFEAQGGRGVELADQIDSLRIALAVRGY